MNDKALVIAAVCGVVLFAAFVVTNMLYKRTNAYKNRFVPALGYLKGVPFGLKFAAFGSTYGMFAFNSMKHLLIKGFNFCLPSESIEADLSILKQYVDHLDAGCVVAINLSACVAMCEKKDVRSSNNEIYSKILEKNNISSGLACMLKRMFPLTIANWKQFARIFIDVPSKKDVLDSYAFVGSEEEAKKNMAKMVNGWKNMFHLSSMKESAISEGNKKKIHRNIGYMKNFISLCEEKRVCPVFVIPPVSAYLGDYISYEFLDATLFELTNAAADERIPVYNYLNRAEFQHDLSLFQDGGFRLSAYGSRKFMNVFFDDLRNDGFVIDNEQWGIKP